MQVGSGVGAGVGGGGGGGVGAGVGSAVGRGVGAAVGRGVGVAVGGAVGADVGCGVGVAVGGAGTGVGWGVAPGAPGVGATGAPRTPGAPPSPPETSPPPGPVVAPGANEPMPPDGFALAPATSPVGAAPEAPAAVIDAPGDTTTRLSRPGPEAAGTIPRNDIATTAVMIRPRAMPIAVWRWSGSIRTIGLLLTRPLGRHRDPRPRIRRDGVTDGCGVVRWGYEDVSGTGIPGETVVRRRAR